LVLAPLGWLAQGALFTRVSLAATQAARIEGIPSGPGAAVTTVLAPDVFHSRYLPYRRRAAGLPTPRRWRTLSIAPYDHRVTRPDTTTLELEVINGHMLGTPVESMLRSPDNPLRPGSTVDLEDIRVEVLATDEVGPTRVRFHFDRALDDPDLAFLAWQDGSLARFRPPPVGDSVTLRWMPGPSEL
jgi:hypothetical protein